MTRLAAMSLLCLLIFVVTGAGATIGPAAPTNLTVVSATEDTITLAWGPSQVGDFFNGGEPQKNKVIVGWGASTDTRGPVTYTFAKDGSTLATGLTSPQYTVSVSPKVKSFRVCVTPASIAGAGPQSCGTFSR